MSDRQTLADDLAAWGKVIVIEARGRSSGQPRLATVGYLDDGVEPLTYRVAASDDQTDWARNLLAEPACHVIADGIRTPYRAIRLEGAERHAVATELILKYGTPSERLGAGPAFRLEPDDHQRERYEGS